MNRPNKKTADYYRELPYTRRIRLEEDADGDSYFVAYVEELPGLEADGATPPEAFANLADAFEDYLAAMLEWGEEIPEPQSWPASYGWVGIAAPSAPVEIAGTAEASPSGSEGSPPPPEWAEKIEGDREAALTSA